MPALKGVEAVAPAVATPAFGEHRVENTFRAKVLWSPQRVGADDDDTLAFGVQGSAN